ncbi:uncharacterized protein PAE49_003145 isoform 1-T3 [Odontesthes bonariensis]|uniref:uncharacterized protein LOC142377048 n=1 Tax=Odontesthes bonariensis TaxID=219752 RepID=UPI003F58839B
MEEAYSELYQQFLRLRSLCLRQAALLHQLTTALQKQQGATVPNGEVSDMISIPVQCTHEIPVRLYEKPRPLTAAAVCGVDHPSRNVGTPGLDEDLLKLSVDVPYQRKLDVNAEKRNPFMLTLDSSRCHGDSSSNFKTSGQNHPGEDRALETARMPVTECSLLAGGLLSQSGGELMSDVVLQSHVCEFCQAVFPGDAATGGEFLRHLYTHVT